MTLTSKAPGAKAQSKVPFRSAWSQAADDKERQCMYASEHGQNHKFRHHSMLVQATGKKPAWETGSSMALPRKAPPAKAQSKAPSKSAWSLAPDDEDVELLDDSELLTEEDLQRPAVPCMSYSHYMHFDRLSFLLG